jgi:hypothetical protein
VSRATSNETLISFENIYSVMEEMSTTVILPFEGPDPKVAEFLRILEGLMRIFVLNDCSVLICCDAVVYLYLHNTTWSLSSQHCMTSDPLTFKLCFN